MVWRTMGFYLALLVIGVAGAVGDIWLYRWAKSYRVDWLAAGLSSWIASLIMFGLLLRHGERSLGVTFVLSAVVHIVAVLGWEWARGETKTSGLLWVGLVVAATGVVLIELGQHAGGGSE